MKSNTKRVEELWRHACMNKEWPACHDLSVMYRKGVEGIAPDPQLADRYNRIYHTRSFENVD